MAMLLTCLSVVAIIENLAFQPPLEGTLLTSKATSAQENGLTFSALIYLDCNYKTTQKFPYFSFRFFLKKTFLVNIFFSCRIHLESKGILPSPSFFNSMEEGEWCIHVKKKAVSSPFISQYIKRCYPEKARLTFFSISIF
jgi:hypothetical protein